jgi:hypothetical protein
LSDLKCLHVANKHQQKYRQRLLKDTAFTMNKSILLALPILLLTLVSVMPASAKIHTNNQSTTCIGNNNSGYITSINGQIMTLARTITRAVKMQAPLKVMMIN